MKRWLLLLVCGLFAFLGCSTDVGRESTGHVTQAVGIAGPQANLTFTQDSTTTIEGADVTFTVNLGTGAGATQPLKGTLLVYDVSFNNQTIYTQPIAAGAVGALPPIVFKYSSLQGCFPPGCSHDIHAQYSGDTNNGPNDVPLATPHTVILPYYTQVQIDLLSATGGATQSANPSVYGEPIHVTLTVSENVVSSFTVAPPPPSLDGNVHLSAIDPLTADSNNGPTLYPLGDCAIAGGSGSCDVSSVGNALVVENGWQIQGDFTPTDPFYWGTSTGSSSIFDIIPAATTAKINDSQSPSVVGSPVTVTVEVDEVAPSTYTPVGSVSIYKSGDATPLTLQGGGTSKVLVSNIDTVTVTDARLIGAVTASPINIFVAFTPGPANIYANDNFGSSDNAKNPWPHSVAQDGTTRTLTSNPVYNLATPWIFGNATTFSLSVVPTNAGSGAATGTVAFYDNTVSPTNLLANTTLVAQNASFTTSSLSLGAHTIVAVYSGDADHAGGNATLNGIVVKATPTVAIILNPKSTVYSGPVTYGVTVTGDGKTAVTGTVQFFDGTTPFGSALDIGLGAASFSDNSLGAASHSITVKYSGDAHYANAQATDTLSISQDATNLNLTTSAQPATVTDNVTFTATVTQTGVATNTPSGSVSFVDGTTPLGTVSLNASGVATLTTNALNVATHHITASYAGDTNWGASSANLDQQILAAGVTSVIQASPNPALVNQQVTFIATFGTAAAGQATGSVDFFDGTTKLATVAISGGNAQLATSTLGAGPHTISAQYAGDATHQAASASVGVTINRVADTIALATTAGASTEFGAPVPLTATVTTTSGTATGSVTFKDGTTILGTSNLDATGVATFSTSTLGVGTHALTAAYSGDLVQAPSVSNTIAHDVTKAATTITVSSSQTPAPLGGPVVFTATITGSPASGFPFSGTVSFSDGSTVIGSGNVSGLGVATFSTSALTAGSHSITAAYAGDAHFQSSTSSPFTQGVSATAATISLTSSPNPSTTGDAVTLAVTVHGSGATPTGTVTFRNGATTLGTGTLDGSGKASITAGALPVGVLTLSVDYAGNGTYDAGTANTTQVVAKAASSTTLTVSTNSTALGVVITFTANVTSPKTGISGDVEFFDGTTSLGSLTLALGVATFNTSHLTLGQHAITARYKGTDVYAASTSNTLIETITAAVSGSDAGASSSSSSGDTTSGGGASSGNNGASSGNTGTADGGNTGVGTSGNLNLGAGKGSGGDDGCATSPGETGTLTAPMLLIGVALVLTRRRRKSAA
jgi:MYXO-CTERM domain-containing protein